MTRHDVLMCKIGLIAFATALLLSGVSYAADKITLVCSGTTSVGSSTLPMETLMTLIVDLYRGTVTSSWVGFQVSSITQATESNINFEGAKPEFGTWEGRIDRYSGSAWLSAKTRGINSIYELTCKPAKPLF